MTQIEAIAYVVALVVIVAIAGVIVWRGKARAADDTANRAKGGGGASHYDGP